MACMSFIRRSSFRPVRTVAVEQSPFTRKTNRSGFDDWAWTCRFDYRPLKRAEYSALSGLIAGQAEGAGMFYAYDPDYGVPLSGFNGTGQVFGAGQSGSTLATYAWPASTLIARAGDRLWILTAGVGYRMYKVVGDVTSDAGSGATFQLHMPLRSAPAANATIGLNWAAAGQSASGANIGIPMRLTGWDEDSDHQGRFTVSIRGEEIV